MIELVSFTRSRDKRAPRLRQCEHFSRCFTIAESRPWKWFLFLQLKSTNHRLKPQEQNMAWWFCVETSHIYWTLQAAPAWAVQICLGVTWLTNCVCVEVWDEECGVVFPPDSHLTRYRVIPLAIPQTQRKPS